MAEIQLIKLSKAFESSGGYSLLEKLVIGFVPDRLARDQRADMAGTAKGSGFRLKDLYLTLPDSMTTALVGPNGCGKTTILKLIAGLIKPDSGEIRFDGHNVNDVPAGERDIGMVFQDFALYPHYTSRENILSYFLFRPKTPEMDGEARQKLERTGELLGVEMEKLFDRYPGQLSAGEKQRVAIGRAITREADVLLLDEPFAHLDAPIRDRYRGNLDLLLSEFGVTAAYVTHDQQEARMIADRLAVMNIGTIEQVGRYEEIYQRPSNLFVAEFLNVDPDTPALNRLEGHHISTEFGGRQVGVRPEDLRIVEQEGALTLEVRLQRVRPLPVTNEILLVGETGPSRLTWKEPSGRDLRPGDLVTVQVGRCHIFRGDTGRLERQVEF